jgi:hypothetical protein
VVTKRSQASASDERYYNEQNQYVMNNSKSHHCHQAV